MTEDCLELEFGGTSETTDDDKGFVCFSGGKDSTAMLLRMLELNDPENYPVNRIAFSDTTFEFQELYDYLLFIDCYIQEKFPGAPKVERYKQRKHGTNGSMERLQGVQTKVRYEAHLSRLTLVGGVVKQRFCHYNVNKAHTVVCI